MVVFVCEHGAAKSIIAAAYFNLIAHDLGLSLKAVGRGTKPDHDFSPQTIKGLTEDGLAPSESIPMAVTDANMKAAQRVVAFCDMPLNYHQYAIIEYWRDVPPVSENYGLARDAIVSRIHQLLNSMW